ncbi:MAG: hypothetical protein LQ343_006719 [Gyalolechia ehrenbergii]|nr:MAG: hypothetical protein LQ343_006719 [Gyalolechia ehrenbergii]
MVKEDSIKVAASPDTLILSLAWAPQHLHSDFIAVSLSTGVISMVDSVRLMSESKHHSHSLEAWVTAWSMAIDYPAVYSGGDDSALCLHRLRNAWEVENVFDAAPQATLHGDFVSDSKIHRAGVTSIVPLWINENNDEYLLTGSYDEYVRVVQIKSDVRKPQVLVEKRLDGGVWQLRQLEVSESSIIETDGKLSFMLLASCMHAGCKVFRICRMANGDWSIEILGKFEEHESMNYASDARLEASGQSLEDMTFVSTSFYDKKMCVWKLEDT